MENTSDRVVLVVVVRVRPDFAARLTRVYPDLALNAQDSSGQRVFTLAAVRRDLVSHSGATFLCLAHVLFVQGCRSHVRRRFCTIGARRPQARCERVGHVGTNVCVRSPEFAQCRCCVASYRCPCTFVSPANSTISKCCKLSDEQSAQEHSPRRKRLCCTAAATCATTSDSHSQFAPPFLLPRAGTARQTVSFCFFCLSCSFLCHPCLSTIPSPSHSPVLLPVPLLFFHSSSFCL